LVVGLFLLLGGASFDLLRPAVEITLRPHGQASAPKTRETKGRELRTAITKAARDLPSGAKFSLLRSWRRDEISQDLESLVPLGLSFDEAEDILLKAGFYIVQPRLEPYVLVADHPDGYSVRATLDGLMGGDQRTAHVDAILVPRRQGDYSAVGIVQIDITIEGEPSGEQSLRLPLGL
jgi:hypothetical protein